MNLELWQSLAHYLAECENDPACRSLIFQSGLSNSKKPIFTAGNDLMELFAPMTSKERYIEFWKTSNLFLARLYISPLITIAAIDGYCPAGGSALAFCCDFRIATENVVMGLNEVQLGIAVPFIWTKLMATLIGHGRMEKVVVNATMIGSKQGLLIGLVDQVVASKEELIPAAFAVLKSTLKYPDSGRVITKTSIRKALADEWSDAKRLDAESNEGWAFLSNKATVQALQQVLNKMGGNKPKL